LNLVNATLLRKAVNYFLFGNIFISVCVFCLFWATCILIRSSLPLGLGIWVALATFFLYNFDSLLPVKLRYQAELSPRKAWVLAHRQVGVSAVIMAGLLLLFLSWQAFILDHFWLLAHLAIISFP
jgi:xanthine/uracil/vitamin C permease (AzgA family)